MKTPTPWYYRLFIFVVWPVVAPMVLFLVAVMLVAAWFAILNPKFEIKVD